jgi:hypothetical protein
MFSRQSLLTAIADYENNLRNFKSGRVKPRPGEVAANRRELRQRKEALTKLQPSTHGDKQ